MIITLTINTVKIKPLLFSSINYGALFPYNNGSLFPCTELLKYLPIPSFYSCIAFINNSISFLGKFLYYLDPMVLLSRLGDGTYSLKDVLENGAIYLKCIIEYPSYIYFMPAGNNMGSTVRAGSHALESILSPYVTVDASIPILHNILYITIILLIILLLAFCLCIISCLSGFLINKLSKMSINKLNILLFIIYLLPVVLAQDNELEQDNVWSENTYRMVKRIDKFLKAALRGTFSTLGGITQLILWGFLSVIFGAWLNATCPVAEGGFLGNLICGYINTVTNLANAVFSAGFVSVILHGGAKTALHYVLGLGGISLLVWFFYTYTTLLGVLEYIFTSVLPWLIGRLFKLLIIIVKIVIYVAIGLYKLISEYIRRRYL